MMSDLTDEATGLPEAAIEAAAKNLWETSHLLLTDIWEEQSPEDQGPWRRDARAAIAAIAPFIRALTEATRADERRRIAEAIRVEMRRHDRAQVGFSAIGDAYANAARIAERGGQ